MPHNRKVAYFSMEIGIHPDVPTYSGGLGMLAGDMLRSAADLRVPMVAVTLLHRKGYFYQRLDGEGWQSEEAVHWVVDDFLTETDARVEVLIEGRPVHLRAWRYDVRTEDGFFVPVYFLDSDLPENDEGARALTQYLYGGDKRTRLCQEAILGMGGVRILRALGHDAIERFHMNEGHAALLTLELLREVREKAGRDHPELSDYDAVRQMCVFTTHTPVPAGHDQFPLDLVEGVLGNRDACGIHDPICHEDKLNMTYLALELSHYVNGVAKKHGEVSRHMYAEYHVDAITNGVHAATWVAPPFADLFDRTIPGWRQDNFSLRYALSIPPDEIWKAHEEAKRRLIDHVNRTTNAGFDHDDFTIGFARRATAYKRADLVFEDPERLRQMARQIGPIQMVFAGKAHPRDETGKHLIQHIVKAGQALAPDVLIAYLPNYDMTLGQVITAGVDVWLNTPEPPMEASGTSGMKATLNGVPSLSVLDGWWIEGCIEGVTGWAIGDRDGPHDREADAAALYQKMEEAVLPLFYRHRDQFIRIMRGAIALNGSFFNTQRMVQQYVVRAYFE